jgi:hypothetical protein
MYCVKFFDRLRGKFGFLADTTDYADVTDKDKSRRQKGNQSSSYAETSLGGKLEFSQQKATKGPLCSQVGSAWIFLPSYLLLENDSAQSMIAPHLSVLSV